MVICSAGVPMGPGMRPFRAAGDAEASDDLRVAGYAASVEPRRLQLWIGGGQRNAVPDPESPALHSWPTECSRAEPARVCNGVCNRRGHNLTRPGTSSASRFKSGGQADGFGRRGSGDGPASRLGIGADGVGPWNAVHQGEVVENRESVERSAEVATARVVGRVGLQPASEGAPRSTEDPTDGRRPDWRELGESALQVSNQPCPLPERSSLPNQ